MNGQPSSQSQPDAPPPSTVGRGIEPTMDFYYRTQQQPQQQQADAPHSAPPTSPSRLPGRTNLPTRSTTLPSADRNSRTINDDTSHSEDLNHSADFRPPVPPFARPSRPSSPNSSEQRNGPSSSGHSDDTNRRLSIGSASSLPGSPAPPPSSSGTSVAAAASCSACGKVMQGAFVRALNAVYHLQCFKCLDCGAVVASKFFPIDGPDGKQQPLCERDYFRRLNLICGKCGQALRGSYITACNKKFHVEHFTCSVCPTLFGPQDSYYEHEGDVYCHYHYSTRFATKCVGCNSAILKQFVEINRNMRDECWHPECYMINKFWNVKVVSRRLTSPAESVADVNQPEYIEEEQRETSTSLKEKQIWMEQQVYRIWTVLSAYEESSAACISDMLRQVSNGQYLEAIRMAEKFILHVEVLFATIDDLETHFFRLGLKGMSHVREARMLCRKTVDLFTLLSHTQETGSRRMGMTQELLALVTGLAHYLKILIRIALTGALKLEREHDIREAMASFLDKLHLLAIEGGNPGARRMIKSSGEVLAPSKTGSAGTQGVSYGFKSLAPENAGESPFAITGTSSKVVNPPSDLCVKCNKTVEEDCVRLGTYQRWHSQCVECQTCGKAAGVPVVKDKEPTKDDKEKDKDGSPPAPKLSTARRPPANVGLFVYEVESMKEIASFGEVPTVIFCTEHAHGGCRSGFAAVSRLEQYAFLLNVALRRLYLLLKKRGVMPVSPIAAVAPNHVEDGPEHDPYRNSGDIMRMKSVHLDRKLSATARIPKRSTIVESPAGKIAQPTDVLHSQRSQDLASTTQRGTLNQGSMQQQSLAPKRPSMSQQHSMPSQYPITSVDGTQQGQVLRPAFARNNTGVMIVDEYQPGSPTGVPEDRQSPAVDEGITLADIPQLMEVAQAREQHRSLPHQSSTPLIAELSVLELAIVKHAAVLSLRASPLKEHIDLDEILELIETKKGGFWNKLFKSGNEKKIKKKGVFGVPLELLVEREGADSLLGASRTTLRVPSFVDDVISAMRQMDMSIEGIFRKNGNIRRLKDLTEAIDQNPAGVDFTTENPVQLAALLKKFLRDLPDPLLCFKLHRLFIASQSFQREEDCKRYLHLVSLLLPKCNRDTMEVLFVFLKWVASFAHLDEETGSKMDLDNLATVICPSILYSRGRDAARDESFGAIRVVTSLLEHQDEFYAVPEEFLSILHDQDYFVSSMELPSKDFLKKCDTYMRLKASGRTPGMMSPTLGSSPFGSSPSGNLATMAKSEGADMRLLNQRLPHSNSQPFERPATANGQPGSRQQSPHPHSGMQHQPFSHAPLSSQGGMPALKSPQPRNPNSRPPDADWATPPPPSGNSPGSRRSSGEHPFSPNGHAQT